MQTNEEKQFRLSPQVLIMLAVALLALALPVAMVIRGLELGFAPPAPVSSAPTEAQVEAATAPLRQQLETFADETLAPSAPLSEGRIYLEVSTSDPGAKMAELEKQARSLGGMILPKEAKNGARRILVALDREKSPAFIGACLGDHPANGAETLPGEGTRLWVEVLILQSDSQ